MKPDKPAVSVVPVRLPRGAMTLRPISPSGRSDDPPAYFSSVIEKLKIAAETGKNPLYAWEAIARCLSYEILPPPWCMDYIFETSVNILQLMRDVEAEIAKEEHSTPTSPKDALTHVINALGLGSQGRNAFSRLLADYKLKQDASLAELAWAKGVPHAEAKAKIKARRNIASDREAERRIKAGNRLLKRTE